MDNFINPDRPSVYCPGCTHEKITTGLNQALKRIKASPEKVVLVSDIGCSGLFDTAFNVHAVHGTHGRALTYAAGIKLANPDLHVIATMGDGGLGIGGAHFLAACRRNLDLTLLILNNFNFGMTGGQYSVTTPQDAVTSSGFLNRAEMPLDICTVAASAGATFVEQCSGFDPELDQKIAAAILHKGFSVVETLGLCTGRFAKNNKKARETIVKQTQKTALTQRPEFGRQYRQLAAKEPDMETLDTFKPTPPEPESRRKNIALLGSAGMRIVTAGEIACYTGLCAGQNVSVKNDYNITVLKGPCVSEIILSPEKIKFPGIIQPDIIIALSDNGVQRRKKLFADATRNSLIFREKSVPIPDTCAQIFDVDFSTLAGKKVDWAFAGLCLIAINNIAFNVRHLKEAVLRFYKTGPAKSNRQLIEKIAESKHLVQL